MKWPAVLHELEYGQGSCYGAEEEAAVIEAIRAGAQSCGAMVQEFETAFAAFCGAPHALAVSSGTAALELAMIALEVQPGDEVITTPLSWISTANGAAARGADVVFADIDPRTYTLDSACVARKLTPRTKAIIAVHLYGQCCDMDALLALARPRGIRVLEDCAHAPGAEYKGRRAGSLGDIAIFSFGQQKNMGTLGEGGMAVTSDARLLERMRSHRWLCCEGHDPQGKYGHIDEQRQPMGKRYWRLDFEDVGRNFRMTDAQAAAGLVQLRRLDGLNERRRRIAEEYNLSLAGIRGLIAPYAAAESKHVFHIYCVRVQPEFGMNKEEFMWELYMQKRIKPWSHYVPIHLTTAYSNRGHRRGECPVAERVYEECVSLPIHPRLKQEGVRYLTKSVRELAESFAGRAITPAAAREDAAGA
jgi:dTDP-4-amino-4,6-dideoxygalactose transaminase